MIRKLKTFLGVAGLAVLIIVAIFAYNAFADRVATTDILALPVERDGAGVDATAQRQRAPDFALIDWDGNPIRFSDIVAGGKPVVLNFWASWCPACRNEKPGFERVYRDRGEEVRFVMLGLADGVRETIETGRSYIEDGGFTMPVYFDTLQEGVRVYGIRFLPTTVFIDRDGYIVNNAQGMVDEESLRRAIDFMLP
ncbi:MAG: TlpA family protein disulfide reductase [Treponema sp.]|nr:TlpA family protein disulfide reductase [Treponema sp.]